MTNPGFLIGSVLGAVVFAVAFWREKVDSKENDRPFNIWKPIIFGGGIAFATWLIGIVAE